MQKRTIEDSVNAFLTEWGENEMNDFLRDVIPLFELYDVDNESDWVRDIVGEENVQNVRLIRTVYLVSRIAELHGNKLLCLKMHYKDLWKKLENEAEIYEKMGCAEKG